MEFIADAYANFKFIGYLSSIEPLLKSHPLLKLDKGCIKLESLASISDFIKEAKVLRFWDRG